MFVLCKQVCCFGTIVVFLVYKRTVGLSARSIIRNHRIRIDERTCWVIRIWTIDRPRRGFVNPYSLDRNTRYQGNKASESQIIDEINVHRSASDFHDTANGIVTYFSGLGGTVKGVRTDRDDRKERRREERREDRKRPEWKRGGGRLVGTIRGERERERIEVNALDNRDKGRK